jgi:hypothetical protein
MFMKKMFVAAALLLSAVSASASNFRGGDQVYIPIAGHQGGQSGLFISDFYLANLTSDVVVVSAIYQQVNKTTNPADPNTIGQEFPDVLTLQPYERKEFRDFFVNTLGVQTGFGMVILNGCKQGTNCGPDGQGGDGNSGNYRVISAETRIFSVPTGSNPLTAPTTGQLFSGIPWYNYVSITAAHVNLDKVFMTGFTHNGPGAGTYRSNIGLANASQYSSTDLAVSLYKGAYNPNSPATNRITEVIVHLTPLENIQRNMPAMFGSAFVPGNDYFVVVEQRAVQPNPSGVPSTCEMACAAFLAYGSVLDNASGDATTLEPQYLEPMDDDVLAVLYPTQGSGKKPFRRAVRH